MQPLEGLRVLELGTFVSAPYCAKVFTGYRARSRALSCEESRAANPRLVVISNTPYGQDGSHADYEANNLTMFAMGGQMVITGTQDGGPLKNGGYQAENQGGLNAFSAGMPAVLAAERDGLPHAEVARVAEGVSA